MKPAPLLAFAVLSAALPASAASVQRGFIGENGAYKNPEGESGPFMQGPLGVGGAVSRPSAVVPASAPTPAPEAPAPAREASPSVAASPAPSRRSSPASAPKEVEPSRPVAARETAGLSLWNGIVQPLHMTAEQAGAADPIAARETAGRDYDSHILGLKDPSPRAPLLASAPVPGAAAHGDDGRIFVSLEIDPREAGTLRDAVAGLGAAAGFSADARFEAMPRPGGLAMISGWIPAGRLGDALARPGVKRMRLETRARPMPPQETTGEFLVGLRLGDPAHPKLGVDAGSRALWTAAGFRVTRVIGVETAPDGRAVAVVAGTIPLSRLSKAMSLPEVAKISPLGGEVPSPSMPSKTERGGIGLSGFLRFAAHRGPWLILVTLLLALPSLRSPLRGLASVFNPYR